ncbi:MAG TPA: hypothetical protein VJP78_01115 [Thermoleophilia bacterium]|nr:hypothetical protein [Thermoleophilia bacterium]
MVGKFEEIGVGDEVPGLETMLTLDEVSSFLGAWTGRAPAAGSRFTDSAAAQREGFGSSAIVPGRMGLAYIARALMEWLPDGRIEKLDVVFRSPTLQNTRHVAGGIVTGRSEDDKEIRLELDVYLERDDGQRPQRGACVVVLPKE